MTDLTVDAATENDLGPVAQVDKFPIKIYVGNLPYDLTDKGLRDLFKTIPEENIQVKINSRGTVPAGFGFVDLSSEDYAKDALEVNGTTVGGRVIKVEPALTEDEKEKLKNRRRGRRIPRRYKPEENGGTATQADNDAPSGLDAVPSKTRRVKNWRRRRQAARGPKTVAEGAITTSADGDPSVVGTSAAEGAPKRGDRKQRTPRIPAEPSKTELYIQNLPFNLGAAVFQADDLKQVFTDASYNVLAAKVVLKYGPRRLLGFVDVGSHEHQQKALQEMNNKDVGGRPIVVKVAYKNADTEPERAETIEAVAPEISEPVVSEDSTVNAT